MTRATPRPDWGPYLFDDHGQPLCSNTEEEQRLWDQLVADGVIPLPDSDGPAWDDTPWDPDNEPPF